jgi:hypothetical protein
MVLDFQGNVVSLVQIIALVLLVIGVYPYKIRTKNRNLIMHGFLSIAAMGLNLATIFVVMIPTFSSGLASFSSLSLVQLTVVWLHTGLGVAAVVMGLIIIFSWITHPLGELGCAKTWRLMIPTFAVWALVVTLGLAIHIFNIV